MGNALLGQGKLNNTIEPWRHTIKHISIKPNSNVAEAHILHYAETHRRKGDQQRNRGLQ